MGTEAQKDRFAWWSIAAASVVCIGVGAAFLVGLLSGHHMAGVLLIAAGIVGVIGLVDRRGSVFRG
jgi:hypothetical protein